MKRTKKNSFFTFIFSFIPGAVELYHGFTKSGVSLMSLFFFFAIVPSTISLKSLSVICGILWFVAFFHARNISKIGEDELNEVPDTYIWNEIFDYTLNIKSKQVYKWFAIILIFAGFFAIWENGIKLLKNYIPLNVWKMYAETVDIIPKIIISVALIVLGIVIIIKKVKRGNENEK